MLRGSLRNEMKHCLYCLAPLPEHFQWKNVFLSETTLLCETCRNMFTPLPKNVCPKCSKPLQKGEETQCHDCIRWEKSTQWKGILEHNTSFYVYNDDIKDFVARWKYRGDAALALVFKEKLRRLYLQNYVDYYPVPIPLSKERFTERGFNQSALLASFLATPYTIFEKLQWMRTHRTYRKLKEIAPQPVLHALRRNIDEKKQSKKSRYERLTFTKNPFVSVSSHEVSVKGKKILLIDDIYTTGMTLRKAAYRLKEEEAASVRSITLFR